MTLTRSQARVLQRLSNLPDFGHITIEDKLNIWPSSSSSDTIIKCWIGRESACRECGSHKPTSHWVEFKWHRDKFQYATVDRRRITSMKRALTAVEAL